MHMKDFCSLGDFYMIEKWLILFCLSFWGFPALLVEGVSTLTLSLSCAFQAFVHRMIITLQAIRFISFFRKCVHQTLPLAIPFTTFYGILFLATSRINSTC